MEFDFIEKIKKDFYGYGYVSVWKKRKNHIFFKRAGSGEVYDTKTADAKDAYFIIGGWIKNGFPQKKDRKKEEIGFAEFCLRYWQENWEARPVTKNHIKQVLCWIRNWVVPYFKGIGIGSVTPQQVRDFLNGLRNSESCHALQGRKHLAPASIRQIRNAISLPLQYAGHKGINARADWLAVCRVKSVRNGEDGYFAGMVAPRDIFEADELNMLDLAEWSDARARICYVLARWCGLRYGEIRGMKIGKVQPDRVIVDTAYNNLDKEKGTKTGQYREVPIAEWLYIEIRNYVASLPEEARGSDCWLLPSATDLSKPIRAEFFIERLNAMLKRLGIPKHRKVRGVVHSRTVHSLRHCYDMELMDAGLTIKQISAVVGHSAAMVEHYTNHYSKTAFNAAAEKMRAAGIMDNPRNRGAVVLPLAECV